MLNINLLLRGRVRVPTKFALQIVAVSILGVLAGWGFSRYAKGNPKVIEIGNGKYEFDSVADPLLFPVARLGAGLRLRLVVVISRFSQPSEYLGTLQRKYEAQGLRILVVFDPESTRGNIK